MFALRAPTASKQRPPEAEVTLGQPRVRGNRGGEDWMRGGGGWQPCSDAVARPRGVPGCLPRDRARCPVPQCGGRVRNRATSQAAARPHLVTLACCRCMKCGLGPPPRRGGGARPMRACTGVPQAPARRGSDDGTHAYSSCQSTARRTTFFGRPQKPQRCRLSGPGPIPSTTRRDAWRLTRHPLTAERLVGPRPPLPVPRAIN